MASEPQRPLWIRCLDGLVLVLALMLGSLPSWRRIALQCFLFVAVIDGALSISWLVIQIISIPSPIQLNSPAITPIPKGTNNREASEQPSNPTPSSPSSQYLHGATLVVDVGSLYTRYGLSGPTFSCKQFPTVLSTGLGDSKESSPYECNLEPPLMSGRIFNWEALELVWTRVATEHADLPLLLSWSPLYSRSDAERAASFAFDSLAVPALCLGLSPVLSLHAAGRTSGCVLESGESQTLVLCVRDGRAAMDTLSTSAFSGEAMSQRIRSLLIAQDRYSHLTNNPTKLRRAKEKYMCVSANKFMAMYQASATTQRSFALPDATRVFTESDDNEDSIWSCADAMFSQVECDLLNALSPGYVTMHDCVASAVAKYKGAAPERMWSYIVLAGGNSCTQGFAARLTGELIDAHSQVANRIKIWESPNTIKSSAWLGGTVVASMPRYDGWITREEYEEYGLRAVDNLLLETHGKDANTS